MQRQEDGVSRLKRVILIGDHHQLPPVVKNMAFQKYSHLDQSLFTRFVRLGTPYVQLNAQVPSPFKLLFPPWQAEFIALHSCMNLIIQLTLTLEPLRVSLPHRLGLQAPFVCLEILRLADAVMWASYVYYLLRTQPTAQSNERNHVIALLHSASTMKDICPNYRLFL